MNLRSQFQKLPFGLHVQLCLIAAVSLALFSQGSEAFAFLRVPDLPVHPLVPRVSAKAVSSTQSLPVEPELTDEVFISDAENVYIYGVRMGESWHSIAGRFDSSFASLRDANSEVWSRRGVYLQPGDELAIPNLDSSAMVPEFRYEVAPGDSWHKVADHFGVFFWDLRLDNWDLWQRRQALIVPGDVLLIRSASKNLPELVEESPSDNMGDTAPVGNGDASEEVQSGGESGASAGDANTVIQSVEQAQEDTTSEALESPTNSMQKPTVPEVGAGLPPLGNGPIFIVVNPPEGSEVYSVRPGDSWYAIAARFGLDFVSLRLANPALWTARGSRLLVGDQLIVPVHDQTHDPIDLFSVEVPAPISSEEKSLISADAASENIQSDSSSADEAEFSAAEHPSATPSGSVGSASRGEDSAMERTDTSATGGMRDTMYIVVEGDSWRSIAAKHRLPVEVLQAVNSNLIGTELAPGDLIHLP